MRLLSRHELMPLETYAQQRGAFRASVMQHKARRRVPIGPNATLYFEDRLTIQYQIQEMLRVERIFEPAAIEDELHAYNALIPDGDNLKATFMLEYTEVEERQRALAQLVGIESRVWLAIDDHERVYAVADEDLERATEEKTSAVHFLRFEIPHAMVAKLRSGAALSMGIDHERYRHAVSPVDPAVRDSLLLDLD